nr:pyrimidine dimer DNA glycosylase/endonuclease V [bacterium]
MNIFVLDENPKIAATYVLDKHAVKMPTESLQMMSTIADHLGFDSPYKPVMLNHPCTIWARESKQNFEWLKTHAIALCHEYTKRYNRIHKCELVIKEYNTVWDRLLSILPDIGLTPFAQAMPDYCRDSTAVKAYRDYYMIEKSHIATWKTETPTWFRVVV